MTARSPDTPVPAAVHAAAEGEPASAASGRRPAPAPKAILAPGDPAIADVVVLLCCYRAEPYLEALLASLAATRSRRRFRVVAVDNASPTPDADRLAARPWVELVRAEANLGFAGGNNLGWAHIAEHHADTPYLILLNQDMELDPGWLDPLVDHLEAHPEVGAVQPMIRLHPETDRINTAGNRSHYLGYGFMTGYREPDRGQYPTGASIDYASGAAVVVRTEALRELGLFDDDYFMYLEDAELGWKLHVAGWAVQRVSESIVHHKYTATAPFRYYFELERNRLTLLLTYYRWPTLVLIAPAAAAMEVGQWLFALRHGLIAARLRLWQWLLSPSTWRRLGAKRRAARALRRVADRVWIGRFAGAVEFEAIGNPLLRYLGNPLLAAYWALIRRLIPC